MNDQTNPGPAPSHRPEILAPAGDHASLLAALAAGADAVYLGLKRFSARMQADNFSVKELARIQDLATRHDAKLYVAMNTLIAPGELDAAGRLLDRLARKVQPAAIIVQDLATLELARQTGFAGEIHLSTLAAVSHPEGLAAAARLGAKRVVLPRELNIDEMKAMAAACPPGLDLEVFVHGALCYCVSGRCYWSSYMGGKSGLRGRCVQPCRRLYTQKSRKARFFSALDLGLGPLVKALLAEPRVMAWKIEGRKKGPHYVYYATAAYKLLRDHGSDAQARKRAEDILAMALGRPTTSGVFLPQRPHSVTQLEEQTGSGLLVGSVAKTPEGETYLKPRLPLLAQDLLRVGYEDEGGHHTVKVKKAVPKAGRLDLRATGRGPKSAGFGSVKSGTSVFLVDRREPELTRRLGELEKELQALPDPKGPFDSDFAARLPQPVKHKGRTLNMTLRRNPPQGKEGKSDGVTGLWLSPGVGDKISRTLFSRYWWWLPPVLWPDEEEQWRGMLARMTKQGARNFVCNAPWQIGLFADPAAVNAVAGPFCNAANALALDELRRLGFAMAFASPELNGESLLALPAQSPLPLGVVLSGYWPAGVSRHVPQAKPMEPMASPKGEVFWTHKYGPNLWIFPNWALDLGERRAALAEAGYGFFVRIFEPRPSGVPDAGRTSAFNWDLELL